MFSVAITVTSRFHTCVEGEELLALRDESSLQQGICFLFLFPIFFPNAH